MTFGPLTHESDEAACAELARSHDLLSNARADAAASAARADATARELADSQEAVAAGAKMIIAMQVRSCPYCHP